MFPRKKLPLFTGFKIRLRHLIFPTGVKFGKPWRKKWDVKRPDPENTTENQRIIFNNTLIVNIFNCRRILNPVKSGSFLRGNIFSNYCNNLDED